MSNLTEEMPNLDLNNTFGALLIGIFVSAILFGVTCTQVFFYFQNYESDHFIIKLSVVLLLILEALHSAFSIHAVYYYFILNYFNPPSLATSVWSATMTLGISTGIILVVHLFYIRRIYFMSRKNISLVALMTVLALAHFALVVLYIGSSVEVSHRAFKTKLFADISKFWWIIDTSLALAVATDVGIALALTYYLHTSRSGVTSTDTLINKLMIYTINNGILTSVFDIIVLVFVTTEFDNLIFLAIFQVVGNLYTNSMMATLNSRQSVYSATLKRGQHSGSTSGVPMNTFKVSTGNNTIVNPASDNEPSEYKYDERKGDHLVQIMTTKSVQIV